MIAAAESMAAALLAAQKPASKAIRATGRVMNLRRIGMTRAESTKTGVDIPHQKRSESRILRMNSAAGSPR